MIPSEAVDGLTKLPFDVGIAHFDDPPPDVIDDLEALRAADRFRFANELRAWIEVEDGRITRYGHCGGGRIGATTMRLGGRGVTIPAVPFPDLRPAPEVGTDAVRFVQTAGGRTGVPTPRRVNRPPFVQVAAPLAWTTLALTISVDGTARFEMTGASPFPRHETALERQLSLTIMRGGATPHIRELAAGDVLVRQGERGEDLFLLLDGVLVVDVDGTELGEIGPGAILGERSALEGGVRTSTLRAVTPVKVAAVPADAIDPAARAEVSKGHRHEER